MSYLEIYRAEGNPGAEPAYRSVGNMIVQTDIDKDTDPAEVVLTGEATGRTGNILSRQLKAYVHPRN